MQGQREPLCPGCGGGATLSPAAGTYLAWGALKRRKTSDNPEPGAVRPDRLSNLPGSSSAKSNPYFSNSSYGEE